MKRLLFVSILLLLTACFVFSYDFGLLVNQQIEVSNSSFGYIPAFVPWFSLNGSNGLSVYASGYFSLKYNNYNDNNEDENGWRNPVLLPELSRFSAAYRINPRFSIEAGRIGYSDTMGLAALGLFDGLRLEADLGKGKLSVGAFYTGLLYKETAMIIMTESDIESYLEPWDFSNFGNYFASKRLLASLRYDMPIFEYHILTLEALAQFDLNGTEETLNSQYGSMMIELFPQGKVGLIFGAVFETMLDSNGDFNMAIGALARYRMDAPTPLNDGINVIAKFGSGLWNDTFTAFLPVSSPAQGIIFPGNICGLAVFSADYTVRLHYTVSAETAFMYYMRSYNDVLAKGNLYGGELQASVAWQPLDDLRLTVAAVVFFPGMGNAYPDGTETMWKIMAGFAISF